MPSHQPLGFLKRAMAPKDADVARGNLRGLSLVLFSLMGFIAGGVTLLGKLAMWGLTVRGIDLTPPVSGAAF